MTEVQYHTYQDTVFQLSRTDITWRYIKLYYTYVIILNFKHVTACNIFLFSYVIFACLSCKKFLQCKMMIIII